MFLEYFDCEGYLLILTEPNKRRGKSLLPLMQHPNVYSALLHQSSFTLKKLFS